MLAPAGGMSLLAFDNDKMGYSALCGIGDTFWFADASLLVHKVNPRLCRGQKKAYGEGKSRQEKVSELE